MLKQARTFKPLALFDVQMLSTHVHDLRLDVLQGLPERLELCRVAHVSVQHEDPGMYVEDVAKVPGGSSQDGIRGVRPQLAGGGVPGAWRGPGAAGRGGGVGMGGAEQHTSRTS